MKEARTYINAILKLNSDLTNREIEESEVVVNFNIKNMVVDRKHTYTLSPIEVAEIKDHLGEHDTSSSVRFEGKCKEQIQIEDKENKITKLELALDEFQDHLDFLREQKNFLFDEILETRDALKDIHRLLVTLKG